MAGLRGARLRLGVRDDGEPAGSGRVDAESGDERLQVGAGIDRDFVLGTAQGENTFVVKAVDRAGNTSQASNAVTAVLWGWAVGQYPMLLGTHLDLGEAAAPEAVLRPLIAVLAGGTALLVPSLLLLYGMFQSEPGDEVAV